MSDPEGASIASEGSDFVRFVRKYLGSREYINGIERRCLWINDGDEAEALRSLTIAAKISGVANFRSESTRPETVKLASVPHKFAYRPHRECDATLIVPSASSLARPYLPCGILSRGAIVSNLAFALYDAELWTMAVVASRLHLVWVGTVCGKLKTDFRYSNTLGWNTFPVPTLSDQNKVDLTRCAEDILLAREAHFPATIANLYDPETMPANLREAHEHNVETLERIYIGRRFKNDTERLEKLFELYKLMTAKQSAAPKPTSRGRKTFDS